MRAYGEITHFEEQLVAHGILLVKFWIHITKDEQLRRFRDRKPTAHKRWKITDEDWRNRARWADYTLAVNEMVARTSTRIAPWTLVEGNDKNFARVKVLRTLPIAWSDGCANRRLRYVVQQTVAPEGSSCCSRQRQPQCRAHAALVAAILERERAAVAFGDLTAQHQPDTGSAGLGREERDEEVAGVLQSRPFVLDPHFQHVIARRPARLRRHRRSRAPRPRHCAAG